MKNNAVIGCDLYNGTVTGDAACTLTASTCASANHAGPTVLILNDQGGSVMDISEDVTATLRAQDHGHPPVICKVAAFMGGQGAKARSIAYCDDGTTPTLKSVLSGGNTVPDVVYCFEPGIAKRERSDSRFIQDRCGTLRAYMVDNQPAVCFQQNH